MKMRPKPPEYKIVSVAVAREAWRQWVTEASLWVFRVVLLTLLGAGIAYNQYALSHMKETVHELKKSLLLQPAEMPIKQMLDRHGGKTLSELDRIKMTKLIVSHGSQGIDTEFTLDLIRRESGYNPRAVSSKGALGLMQLLPRTAEWLAAKEGFPWRGEEMLFEPITNVQFGLAYLKYLSRDFRGQKLLRAAYQAGPNWVRKTMGKGGMKYASNP